MPARDAAATEGDGAEMSRITVDFENEERTIGTMTVWPSWVRRLFGARARFARVHRNAAGWWYVDGGSVPYDLERKLDDQRRWQEVVGLPAVRLEES